MSPPDPFGPAYQKLGASRSARYAARMQVTVVGAGVIGLTTASRSRSTAIAFASSPPPSGGARQVADRRRGVVSLHVGPPAKVSGWAQRTRRWLEQLARTTPEAGIDVLTGYEIHGDDGTTCRGGPAAPTMEGDALATEALDVEWVPTPVDGAPTAGSSPRRARSRRCSCRTSSRALQQPIEQRIVGDLAARAGRRRRQLHRARRARACRRRTARSRCSGKS